MPKPRLPHAMLSELRRAKRVEKAHARIARALRNSRAPEPAAVAGEMLTREDIRALRAEQRFASALQQLACDVGRP